MPIDRDKTLLVLIKHWICGTISENWMFCLLNWINLLYKTWNMKFYNAIISSKKFEGNPLTIDRATVLSVKKEI